MASIGWGGVGGWGANKGFFPGWWKPPGLRPFCSREEGYTLGLVLGWGAAAEIAGIRARRKYCMFFPPSLPLGARLRLIQSSIFFLFFFFSSGEGEKRGAVFLRIQISL